MWIVAFISLMFFAFIFAIPFKAMAEMHEIEINPPQSCGIHCVIESVGFDTKQEADNFWNKYQSMNGVGGHAPYQLNGNNLWFVDYQVTEVESKGIIK